MNDDLILIDGSALIYRSHYAFVNRPLTAPSGELTSVLFGTVNAVLQLVERYRPSHLVMALDTRAPTFRHEIFPRYKANRKPMPEEIVEQLPRLRELLAVWGLPVVEKEGFEADDVMATLARRSAGVCAWAWFYTGDKDFQQLLDARTGMLKPGRRGDDITEVTAADLPLTPAQIIDCFALAGDKSDNIPGAPGIGDKTAAKLIREFGDLETLYARLDSGGLTPRLQRLLGEHREQVELSRRLFRIDSEVPLDVAWEGFRTVLPVNDAVAALMDRLGLQQALRRAEKLAAAMGRPVAGHAPAETGVPAPENRQRTRARRTRTPAPTTMPSPAGATSCCRTPRPSPTGWTASRRKRRWPSTPRQTTSWPTVRAWWASRWRPGAGRRPTCPCAGARTHPRDRVPPRGRSSPRESSATSWRPCARCSPRC